MFEGLQKDQLAGAIEAMLFVTDEPVGTIALADMLEVDPADVEGALVGLRDKLEAENRGIQLRSVESTVEGAHDIRGILGADSDVRNGYNDIKVTFTIDADASKEEIEALVAQSQKRSAVYDILTNPTDVTVEVN